MNDSTRELKIHTACLMVIAALAIGVALYWLRPVLVPFVLALFFAAGLAPILDLIEQRLGAPRIVAVAIAFLLGLALVFLLWLCIWLSVKSLVNNWEEYDKRINQLTTMIRMNTPAFLRPPSENSSTEDSGAADELNSTAPGEPADNDGAGESPPLDGEDPSHVNAADRRKQNAKPPNPFDSPEFGSYVRYWMSLISKALLDISSNTVMVLIFMFFLLLGGTSSAIPRSGVWRDIEGKIRGYIITKSVISALTGLAFGLVLALFGIPLALVFGLLAFLLNFIPNIGPIIASLLPLPLILLDSTLSPLAMVMVIALSVGVQFVSGNVIEPKIMGDSFELHPVAILLTLMLWGMIWGLVGMFLAVPMTAAVNILLSRFEHTKPIADVLAGRFESLTEMLGEKA